MRVVFEIGCLRSGRGPAIRSPATLLLGSGYWRQRTTRRARADPSWLATATGSASRRSADSGAPSPQREKETITPLRGNSAA